MTRSHKQPYTGAKRWDPHCRNHGRCSWCEGNRLHQAHRAQQRAGDVSEGLAEVEGSDAGIHYDERYDSHYDRATMQWIEGVCDDPNCEFCKSRPKEAP